MRGLGWMPAVAVVAVVGCGRYGFSGDGGSDPVDGGVPGDGTPIVGDGSAGPLPDAVPVTGNASCAGIKAGDPNAGNGVYAIDPDGNGAEIQAYCDMTTDGGGWTLILGYVHRAGTTPALVVRQGDLPLWGTDTLGADEAGTAAWGHAATGLVARLPVSQLRFTCRSSAHARVVDAVTTSAMCIDYLRTGTGGCLDIRLTTAGLPGHTGMLPLESTHVILEAGDYAATENTFYKNTMPKANWAIAAEGGAWECDAQASGADSDTIHRVWIR